MKETRKMRLPTDRNPIIATFRSGVCSSDGIFDFGIHSKVEKQRLPSKMIRKRQKYQS